MELTHLNLFSNLLERVSDSKSIYYVHMYIRSFCVVASYSLVLA